MAKKITIPNVTLSIVLPEHKDQDPDEESSIHENLLPKLENLGEILESIEWGAYEYFDRRDLPRPYFGVSIEADIDTMLSKYPDMITIEDYEEE